MHTKGTQVETSGGCYMCLYLHWASYPVVRVFVCDRNYSWSPLSFWTEDPSQSSCWWNRLWTCLNRPVKLQISACSYFPHPDLDRRIWICLHLLMHDQAETAGTHPELFFGLNVWNHLHREDCGNWLKLETQQTLRPCGETCLIVW